MYMHPSVLAWKLVTVTMQGARFAASVHRSADHTDRTGKWRAFKNFGESVVVSRARSSGVSVGMVSFNCDGCGDVVKKPKLAQHYKRCYAPFTCLDCSVQFATPQEAHTSCITEDEKYQKR